MSRPELAARDGSPPPPGLPRGECILTTLADGRIRVDRADPCVLVSAEVLDDIVNGMDAPAALYLPGSRKGHDGYVGATVKIPGVNLTVIYRITEYVASIHAYIAEWPD